MWLSDAKKPFAFAAFLLLSLLLAGCGFEPMYGRHAGGENVAQKYADIEIANIPDRDGQYLRNQLIDRLYVAGRPAAARYVLEAEPLLKTEENQLVRKDATYTRALMRISTLVRLHDRETGEVLLERTLRAAGSYNLLDNQFATMVSRENLTDNLLRELADSIVTAVNLHFRREG